MEDYFGPVADDFWEQGLTWLMNDVTIAKGFNDQYPEKNLVEEGPMTAETIISSLSHETIHMWLQNNNDAIRFNEGQWIWEGVTNPTAMVIEHWDEIGEFFKYDKYGKGFDSFNFYGKEAVNGCVVDGDKANRRYSDYCAAISFYYLTSILSTPGTYDFYAKWNALRNEKGDDNLTDHDEVCEIIDTLANGKTIDGMKASDWFYSQPAANTQGADGTYLLVGGNYDGDFGFDIRFEIYAFDRKDYKETGLNGQDVTVKLYDCYDRELASTVVTLDDDGFVESIDFQAPDGGEFNKDQLLRYSTLRYKATMNYNGKTYEANNYSLSTKRDDIIGLTDNRMFFNFINDDMSISNGLKENDIVVEGATKVDYSNLNKGLLIVEANTGDTVTLNVKGDTYYYSKPAITRFINIECNSASLSPAEIEEVDYNNLTDFERMSMSSGGKIQGEVIEAGNVIDLSSVDSGRIELTSDTTLKVNGPINQELGIDCKGYKATIKGKLELNDNSQPIHIGNSSGIDMSNVSFNNKINSGGEHTIIEFEMDNSKIAFPNSIEQADSPQSNKIVYMKEPSGERAKIVYLK